MNRYNRKTWNYDQPDCLWEMIPWQIRWPLGFVGCTVVGVHLIAVIILLVKGVK